MNCDEYLPLISGHLDGMNSEIEERRLQEHLKTCEVCRALLSQMEQNDALLKGSVVTPPAGLSARIMRQVRKEKQSSASQKKRWIPIAFSGVAAAALLTLVVWGKLPLFAGTDAADKAVVEESGIKTEALNAAAEPAEECEAVVAENHSKDVNVILPSATDVPFDSSEPNDGTYGGIIPSFPESATVSVEDVGGKRSTPTRYTPSAPMLIIWNADMPDALAEYEPEALDEFAPLTANPVPSLYARYQTIVPLFRDFDLISADDGYEITLYTVSYETMMAVFNECAGVYENAIYYPALFTEPDECSVVLINFE